MLNKRVCNIVLMVMIFCLLSSPMLLAGQPEKHLGIKDILELAAEKNTDIKESMNGLKEAKADLTTVQLENYPSLSLETSVEQFDDYNSNLKKADFNIRQGMKLNFTLGNSKFNVRFLNENYYNWSKNELAPYDPTYELEYSYDLLRKTSIIHNNNLEIAKLRVQQKDWSYLDQQSSTFTEVLAIYFNILKATNKKNQNLQKAELLKQHLELTKTKYKQGNATELDVLEMQNALSSALVDAERAENEYDRLSSNLCLEIGLNSSQGYIFDEPSDIVVNSPGSSEALQNNVKIKYSEIDSKIFSKLLENEEKNNSTELTFTATKKEYNAEYSFGLNLKKMLTEDYAKKETLDKATNDKQLAEERQKLEVEKASIEYRSLMNENDILKRKSEINKSTVNQLEQKLKLVREQYKLGGVAQLKVIETIDDLETAKISYQDSYYDYLQSSMTLLIFVNPDLKSLLTAF